MRTHAIISIFAMFLAFTFLSTYAVKAGELHEAVRADNVVLVKLRLTEGQTSMRSICSERLCTSPRPGIPWTLQRS